MAGQGPNWEGLLKWSLSHSDATNPSRNLSEEDRRWFMEAMQAHSVDVIKRMKEITLVMQAPEHVLESQGVTPRDIEGMLDELQEHVESIDNANDLYSIGGLAPLLGYLKNPHSNIRAKAAEVVSTIVQNNPRSQQLVMEANGFQPLLSNFTSDPDVAVRTKALGAISCMSENRLNQKWNFYIHPNLYMGNFPFSPGMTAFRLANGYSSLRDALSSESVRFQRKALNLIHYLLHENKSDCTIANELGFPRAMMHLLSSSEDIEVREAALTGLLELAREGTNTGNNIISSEDGHRLRRILQERISDISTMNLEDLGAVREERHLVDAMWRTCYDEPSSLHEMGLVFISGDDLPPPDVAGRHFEPPLRAWAANRSTDNAPSSNKNEAPLLIGPAP